VLFQAGGAILSFAMAAVEWMARLPFAAARTVTPSWVEVALFYTAFGCVIHLLQRRRGRPAVAEPAAGEGRGGAGGNRGSGFAWVLLALCLLAAAADAGFWFHQRFRHRELRVTLIDVGQGSAALIELPGGRTLLVDGGGFADNAAFDVGAAVVAPFLWSRKIATIDRLILTHPNSDHLNGLVFIAENFNVGSLWTNGEPWHSQPYRALMEAAAAHGIDRPPFGALPRRSLTEGVLLEVLYPPADFVERRESERWRRDPNNNSLVTRFSYGDFSIILPGDIMRPAEKELVAMAGSRLRANVLVAPHHGSRTSNSEDLLEAVQPQAVLISCAGRAGSGLPHPQVIERFAQRGLPVFRTDRHGAIRLVSDGKGFSIEPFIRGE
jgi:competence protein ComEC